MKAAITTRARGASGMRPPGLSAAQDLDVSSSGLLSLGCSRARLAAVSATLGPAAASNTARNPSCHSVDRKRAYLPVKASRQLPPAGAARANHYRGAALRTLRSASSAGDVLEQAKEVLFPRTGDRPVNRQ